MKYDSVISGPKEYMPMKCVKCGNENAENAKFCKKCGTRLTDEQQPVSFVPAPKSKKDNKQKILICIAAAIILVGAVAGVAIYMHMQNGAYGTKTLQLVQQGNQYNERDESEKAAVCYDKAAQRGNADALYKLAFLYWVGDGVPQDFTKAEMLLKKAVEIYTKRADNGDAEAMVALAGMYSIGGEFAGGFGVSGDEAKAVAYYEKAAKLGNADGIDGLASCYEYGKGVPEDKAEAKKLYKKAAAIYMKAVANDDVAAMRKLAFMYEYGQGVESDNYKAVMYLEKAIAKNDIVAMDTLATSYYDGTMGLTQDIGKAIELWQKAADLGSAGAKSNLEAIKKGEDIFRGD